MASNVTSNIGPESSCPFNVATPVRSSVIRPLTVTLRLVATPEAGVSTTTTGTWVSSVMENESSSC